ncbi:hypothetical protein APHAL10511_004158 [Amanita phalloides]|nr:hypothetical protein APHAL10511_004158 [Amanita phalloides]
MRLYSIVIVLHLLLCATVADGFFSRVKQKFKHKPGPVEQVVKDPKNMKPIFIHAKYKLYRLKIYNELVIVKETQTRNSAEKRATENEIDILTVTGEFKGLGLERGSGYDTYYILISNLGKTYEEMLRSDGDKKELRNQLLEKGRKDFDLEKEFKAEFEPAMQEAQKRDREAFGVEMAPGQEHDPNNYMFYTGHEIQFGGGGKREEIGAHILNYNGGPPPKHRATLYGPPPDVWRQKTQN